LRISVEERFELSDSVVRNVDHGVFEGKALPLQVNRREEVERLEVERLR
jgi:hypothetical protein